MSSKPIHHPPPSLPTSPLAKRTRNTSNPFDTPTLNQPPSSKNTMEMDTTADTTISRHGDLDKDIHFPHNYTSKPASSSTNNTTTNTLPLTQPLHNSGTTPTNGPRNSDATVNLILQEERLLATTPLHVARLSDKARVPTRGSKLAAGYDLYCAKTTTLPPSTRALLPTDLAIAVPPGTYGRIAPRSGLSVKKGLQTGAGVIDADYRGHVIVLLFNLGNEEVVVEEGERCAQLVLERVVGADVVDVTSVGDGGIGGGKEGVVDMERARGLVGTERGVGGFGSTGTGLGKMS